MKILEHDFPTQYLFARPLSRSRLLALLVALLAGLAMAGASQARAAQLRGADLHPMDQDRSQSAILTEFNMLQEAGATSVRFDVYWSDVETGPGQYHGSEVWWIDWVMYEAQQHGLKVILDLDSTPCWASSVPATVDPVGCGYGWWNYPVTDYPPTNPQDYADFAAYAAQRWGPNLAALELWNEPNGGVQFISTHPVRNYLALVQAAYPAVKAVDPNLPVLISMGGTDTTFLNQLYILGVKGYYDGIAVHPYYQPTFAGLKALRALELSQGDNAPLWVTEVGWNSDAFGLKGQATNTASALKQLAALPYVAAAEIYDIRDAGTDATNADDSWGLVDYNLNPKPAWNAFESTLQSLARPASG